MLLLPSILFCFSSGWLLSEITRVSNYINDTDQFKGRVGYYQKLQGSQTAGIFEIQ